MANGGVVSARQPTGATVATVNDLRIFHWFRCTPQADRQLAGEKPKVSDELTDPLLASGLLHWRREIVRNRLEPATTSPRGQPRGRFVAHVPAMFFGRLSYFRNTHRTGRGH
jgi:hypothetical protein